MSPHGIWVLAQGEEIFLPYDKFPWFKRGGVEAVLNVEEQSPGHYYWPDLDVDLGIDAMRNPDRYPLSFDADATAGRRSQPASRLGHSAARKHPPQQRQ